MDMDDEIDQSIMSQTTTKAKPAKRGPKGKGKTAKAKKQDNEEVEAQMHVDNVDDVQPEPEDEPEPPKPKRAGRGKKRVSEDINNDEPESVPTQEREQSPAAEPPSKRRATGTRSSSVSRSYNYESHDHEMQDAESVDEAAPKKRGRKPKKATAKGRKASDVSTSSKALTKERLPRDSELDAAIHADLDADADEPAVQEPEQEDEPEPAPRTLKKSKSTKKSKATEKALEPEEVDAQTEEYEEVEEPAPKTKSSKSSKKKSTKKSKKEEDTKAEKKASQRSMEPTPIDDDISEHEHHDSLVSVETDHQNPELEADPVSEAEEKPVKKKSSKKKDEKPKKSKKSKKEPSPTPEPVVEPEPETEVEAEPEPEPESEFEAEPELGSEPEPVYEQHDTRSPSMSMDEFGTPGDIPDMVEMVPSPQPPSSEIRKDRTPVPPKTTKRFSDIPQEEHLAESLNESQRSRISQETRPQRISKSSNRAVSPLPPPRQSTPSLSPQSSDAENRPPSSRLAPSSTPRQQTMQAPLAAATPSPSKRNPNAGFPASAHPWTPVDIDELLYGEASDKENADLSGIFKDIKAGLTSPEKKMNVEQWILWNAKNGEDRLKRECERLVSQFEKEGGRAMQRLEAIECMD